MSILLFEDKLGITSGYRSRWDELLRQAGLRPMDFIYKSAYRTPGIAGLPLLIKKGNRKNPGFNENPAVFNKLWAWFYHLVESIDPHVIVLQDAALLGFVDSDWSMSTLDNLRGGLYWFTCGNRKIPIIVTVPVSVINTGRKTKDIKILNNGAATKEEWEARMESDDDEDETDSEDRDPEAFFMEPYYIPEGRWILRTDLKKIARMYAKQRSLIGEQSSRNHDR